MKFFDLRGPEFLLAYLALSAAVIVTVAIFRRAFESGKVPKLGEPDPYLIAHLRGGPNEALRIATLTLLDRGLLSNVSDELKAVVPGADARVRRPIERSILQAFWNPGKAQTLYFQPAPRAACEALARELRQHGLAPSPLQIALRVLLGVCGVGLLWWVAYTKVELAYARGHHNVAFLVILALLVPIPIVLSLRSRTTPLGARVLRDFQTLFSRLRDRAHALEPGGATNELALLAGIYGLPALSGLALARAEVLFPRAMHKANESAVFSSSSSCGSSCGSCGGGGGGCGGGGCGGCGS